MTERHYLERVDRDDCSPPECVGCGAPEGEWHEDWCEILEQIRKDLASTPNADIELAEDRYRQAVIHTKFMQDDLRAAQKRLDNALAKQWIAEAEFIGAIRRLQNDGARDQEPQ